jgi:hypothetical protein
MKHGARFARVVLFVASIMSCFAVLLFIALHFILPAHASRATVSARVESSPSSGPVGTTIAVSGSGWTEPDGTQVFIGYMTGSSCLHVTNSQTGTLSGGNFSGWFHWPQGTPLGTYTVCADDVTTTVADNTFTVLSESAAQISISPTTLTRGQQATITGSNFLPAGTTVQLSWETANGKVDFGLNSAVSNNNGNIVKTFTVPATTLPGGSYMIKAIVGGGQPPTLSASAPFTYKAPVPSPTPTPSPSPVSNRPLPPQPSPTATVAATPTTTTTASPTVPAATQTSNTDQTPTLNTPTNTSTTSSNSGGVTSTNQPGGAFLIAGVSGSSILLIALLAAALLVRRKKFRSGIMTGQAHPSVGPNTNGALSWQNGSANGVPLALNNTAASPASSWIMPPANGGQADPYPVSQVAPTHNGTSPMGEQPAQLSSIPLPFTPYTQLLQQPAGPDVSDPVLVPNDPMLEAMKKQAQMGLFAVPGPRKDEVSIPG